MAEAVPRVRVTEGRSREWEAANVSSLQSPVHDDDAAGGTSIASPREASAAPLDQAAPAPNGKISPTKLRPLSRSATSHPARQPAQDGSMDSKGETQAPIDPLSQQILKRTSTAYLPQKPRPPADHAVGQHAASSGDGANDPKHPLQGVRGDSSGGASKDKKKGFLSRFIGSSKKKVVFDGDQDAESEPGDYRPEGTDAQLFSHSVDNFGFNPRYPQPPGYIKVRSRYKKEKEFNRLFLAQELRTKRAPGSHRHSSNVSDAGSNASSAHKHDPIWAMEFSKDGKYLAAGGQDKVVRVWTVISTPEERRAHEREEEAANGAAEGRTTHLSAPVFQRNPYREYEGHTATVLDLSWSKNNFLLSSSMDKTVRLWHISRPECLCTFKHSDFVPSIQFHPRDDRFFLAGSLDAKLRLWSIPDKGVAFWQQLPDMITAVAFRPDGKTAIAGTLNGTCLFYETEGLKYQTQIHVRSTHGKNAKGSKITGIEVVNVPPEDVNGEIKILISSNDSRIRLYNYRDKSMEIKFKGHQNYGSQIRATFSEDGRYVVCGSEDRKAYIWSTSPAEGDKRNQRPMEMFEAHTEITTKALFAPTKTRQLLSASEDPVYDICNPPPVTLISRAESIASSKPADAETSSTQATPAALETTSKRASSSPAYIARSAHPNGNIIVTADYTGSIKVFRQDCAYTKRLRNSEPWESSSAFSSKKIGGTARRGRNPSVTTRNSASSVRRSDSNATQPPQDRILSWRQGIASTHSFDSAGLKNTRSQSPRKSTSQVSVSSSRARFDSNAANPYSPIETAALPSISTSPPSPEKAKSQASSPDKLQGGQSWAFWDRDAWHNHLSHHQGDGAAGGLLEPPRPRVQSRYSVVSALSSEESSVDGRSEEDGLQEEKGRAVGGVKGRADEQGEVRCRKCGGTVFKARARGGEGYGLVCSRCGTAA